MITNEKIVKEVFEVNKIERASQENKTMKFSQFLTEESSLKIEPSFSDKESWI